MDGSAPLDQFVLPLAGPEGVSPPERGAARPRRRRAAVAGAIQEPLPLGEVLRTARRRPVAIRPEDPHVYSAVQELRAAGLTVYRSGANHKVDGSLLDTPQLLRLAMAVCPSLSGRPQRRKSFPGA